MGKKGEVPSPAAAEVGLFSSPTSSPAAPGGCKHWQRRAVSCAMAELLPRRGSAPTVTEEAQFYYLTIFLQLVHTHLHSQHDSCFFNRTSLWLGLLGTFCFFHSLAIKITHAHTHPHHPTPFFHFAPAACCRRFPEPFRDPAFVSAVILAILHHSRQPCGLSVVELPAES